MGVALGTETIINGHLAIQAQPLRALVPGATIKHIYAAVALLSRLTAPSRDIVAVNVARGAFFPSACQVKHRDNRRSHPNTAQ